MKKKDYREQFKEQVNALVSNDYSYAEKFEKIDKLTNEYIMRTDERPDPRELDELASWYIFGTKGLSLRKKREIRKK
jgi:tRNA splicing endonuclease